MRKLFLKSDSLPVVRKINDQKMDISTYGHLVNQIKTLLPTSDEFRVGWVSRSANSVTHRLAREGCMNTFCKTWFQVPWEIVVV